MNKQHKQLILDFYSKVIGQGNTDLANLLISENYIQHNPLVKSGRGGFMEFLNMLKKMPKPEDPQKPFMRIITEDEYVAVHLQIKFMGQENAVVDLFRIENERVAEHWDAVQLISDANNHRNPVVKGTVSIDEEASTATNKKLVADFVHAVLVKRRFDLANLYISDDLKQHDPAIENGAEPFVNYLKKYNTFKLYRTIGEHNFVLTQGRAVKGSSSFVCYNIYRLHKGKIVEHWMVKQRIPEQMAHSNGMI